MKNKALTLGLTVLLYTFALRPLTYSLVDFLPTSLASLVLLAISAALAFKLTPRLLGDDEPPPVLVTLLLASAGFCLLLTLWHLASGRFFSGLYVDRLNSWALAATVVLAVRLLSPRYMLFVGVTAFAMQFLAIGLVAAFLSQLGEWLGHLFKLGAAMVIAAWLTLKTDSPSSRVKEVDALWFFGAAGALTMFLAGRSLYLFSYSYAELLIQIGFVLSFIWLLAHLDSGETPGEEASGTTLFMVFVGLYVTLNTVFSLAKIIMDRLPSISHGVLAWLPLIISVGLIIMLMRWLQLKQRLSNDAPGRGLLRAGVVIFVLAVLAGGSIYAGSETGGRLSDLFPVLVTLAVVVLPLTIVAQLLVGIGLLRMCFTLGPRPR